MKRKYLSGLALFAITMCIQAQNTSDDPKYALYAWSQKKYTLTVQPFQLVNSGLKLDFEMRLGDGPGWLQFSPAIYYRTNDTDNPGYYYYGHYHYCNDYHFLHEPYSKLRGGGLDINYKRFLNARRTFYTATGISYTRLNIDYWGYGWHDYIEDGLEYHGYELGFHTQHINRAGLNYYFGFQIPSRHAFVYDMFWGLGYRHSSSDRNKPAFNDHLFSRGWTGFIFLAGVRIGVGW
jgi:hypothetical protein